MRSKKAILVLNVLVLLFSSFVFAEDKKLSYGTGIEYFISDRIYDADGTTMVVDYTAFEFRFPLFMRYNYNKWLNSEISIPFVNRKIEFFDADFDKKGKGIGDIEFSNTSLILEEQGKRPQVNANLVFAIPTGTNDISGAIGVDKMPTGGPLLGSEGVYRYGGSYGIAPGLTVLKNMGDTTLSADIGYRITTAISTDFYRFDPGNIFYFILDYSYQVADGTAIGISYSSFSSERVKLDGKRINGTAGSTGSIRPNFAVRVKDDFSLLFELAVPLYGRNQYKGLGYSFKIVF